MEAQSQPPRITWASVFRQTPPRPVADGEALVIPGEKLSRLYYLERGRLRCSVVSEGGMTKTVLYYWPGDICGETHIFDPARTVPLLITSSGPSTVRSLGLPEARRIMAMNPRLAEELMASLSRKTLAMVEHIRQLRFLPVEARVAEFLHVMYTRVGCTSGDLHLTHEEIADYVGAHRVSVTEALRRIELAGAIQTGRGRIAVRDPGELQRAAGR